MNSGTARAVAPPLPACRGHCCLCSIQVCLEQRLQLLVHLAQQREAGTEAGEHDFDCTTALPCRQPPPPPAAASPAGWAPAAAAILAAAAVLLLLLLLLLLLDVWLEQEA